MPEDLRDYSGIKNKHTLIHFLPTVLLVPAWLQNHLHEHTTTGSVASFRQNLSTTNSGLKKTIYLCGKTGESRLKNEKKIFF